MHDKRQECKQDGRARDSLDHESYFLAEPMA
jgi:hypothetical protein